MTLPVCRWRGREISPGRFACRSTKIIVSAAGVTADLCRGCALADHEPDVPGTIYATITGGTFRGSYLLVSDGTAWTTRDTQPAMRLAWTEGRWRLWVDGAEVEQAPAVHRALFLLEFKQLAVLAADIVFTI